MTLSVVYDQRIIKSGQDKHGKLINDFVQRLTRAAYPGAHLVEIFPWIRYIPSRSELQYSHLIMWRLTKTPFSAALNGVSSQLSGLKQQSCYPTWATSTTVLLSLLHHSPSSVVLSCAWSHSLLSLLFSFTTRGRFDHPRYTWN